MALSPLCGILTGAEHWEHERGGGGGAQEEEGGEERRSKSGLNRGRMLSPFFDNQEEGDVGQMLVII